GLASAFRLTAIGTFFNACLPGNSGGDLAKVYYATAGNRARLPEVATVIVLDRALGLVALVGWPLLVAPLFIDILGSSAALRWLLLLAGAATVGLSLGLLVATSTRLSASWPVQRLLQVLPARLQAERVLGTVQSYRRAPGVMLGAIGISLL